MRSSGWTGKGSELYLIFIIEQDCTVLFLYNGIMERAKELYLYYSGNRYYMSLNGDEKEYDSYHVSKETEEAWRTEYLTQFFEQELYGKAALGSYSKAVDFLKSDGSDACWERLLYYPLRSAGLDDVTVLYMLMLSCRLAEKMSRKGTLPEKKIREYLQALDVFVQEILKRAEDGTLTRHEDYTLQEFSDPVYTADYLNSLRQSVPSVRTGGKSK